MEKAGMLGKLTLAGMGLDKGVFKSALADNDGAETEVATVLCVVTEMKPEASRLDPSKENVRFFGNFEGTNLLTGEVFYASAAFFPSIAESFLRAQLGGKAGSDGPRSVVTGFTVTVKEDTDKRSALGYKFGCNVLVDKENSDPFAEMRAMLPSFKGEGKKIAAPKKGKK